MEGVDFSATLKNQLDRMKDRNPEFVESIRVKEAWGRVIDNSILEHIDGLWFGSTNEGMKLIAYVDDSLWAADLNMQSELMRLKVNHALDDGNRKDENALFPTVGKEVVERLQFVVSRPDYQPAQVIEDEVLDENDERKSAKPIALSAEEMADLLDAAKDIEDEKLKTLIIEAAKADLELQKGLKHTEPSQD